MSLKIKIIFLVQFLSYFGYSQIRLNFEYLNIEILPTSLHDTINKQLIKDGDFKGKYAKINLESLEGKSEIQIFDSRGNLFCTGKFKESKDTLIKYVYGKILGKEGEIHKFRVKRIKYLIPLPTGEWIFYKKGKVISKKVYDYVL